MSQRSNGPNILSSVLMASGLVVLLGVVIYFVWNQHQAQQLPATLRQTPVPVALSTGVLPTIEPASPTPAPTATGLPPTATPLSAAITPPTDVPTSAPARPIATQLQETETATPTALPTVKPASMPAGPPVRIVISDPINIDVPVVEMGWQAVQTAKGSQTDWVIPKQEAGHHIDSAQLGEQGNVVISGHNNIYGRVFERISRAWPSKSARVDDVTESSDILNGRTIALYNAAGQRFDYVITDFLRLKDTGVPLARRIENARFMQPAADARLTLVTCWPPWSNTHRLIVIAEPAGQP